MRILIISKLKSWQRTQYGHLARGFSANGHVVRHVDHGILGKLWNRINISLLRKELYQRQLERTVREFRPDLILFIIGHLTRIDVGRLRSYYRGLLTFWDYDGPNHPIYDEVESLRGFDGIVSVSRAAAERLRSLGFQAFYLPHGVDCDFYRPGLPGEDDPRFSSPVSYIGNPTPRRIEMCRRLIPHGLALYGRRWHLLPEAQEDPRLSACIRGTEDILDEDVVGVYRNSSCVLNTLRENLAANHTIMSLQVFAVPACEGCLVTEYVDELPDAFENGRELLWYHDLEEAEELIRRYARDRNAAKAIGASGRKRCLAEHTQRIRTRQFVDLFS